MSEPFLGEIKITSFTFAPKGWAQCNGQLLPINQNQALFSLLGTTFGGDGRQTFALPDLRGRAPVHNGTEIQLGARAGTEAHTLNQDQLPAHNHGLLASANQATSNAPAGNVLAAKPRRGKNVYAPSADTALHPSSVSTAPGGSQPHSNMQPYLVLNFVIALQGIFPSRN